MKAKIISTLVVVLLVSSSYAQQKYFTKSGHVSFYSEAPMENIEADNHQAVSVIDFEKNEIAITMLMKAFEFEKSLMQEHFNENYVESDKFPKASFKGSFPNPGAIDSRTDGIHELEIEGDLTIHGVTRPVSAKAIIEIKDQKIVGRSTFSVLMKDYDIKVPKVVVKNIAEVVEVKVNFDYRPYQN